MVRSYADSSKLSYTTTQSYTMDNILPGIKITLGVLHPPSVLVVKLSTKVNQVMVSLGLNYDIATVCYITEFVILFLVYSVQFTSYILKL